ncbi:DUF6000 family protein [Kribbella sp. CA-245084]|uniref:DUF6000 family protein n=1 Tax=Kribbella sp. CA-245084 TaxID=3239940 RepID=UPI003D92470F
MVWPRPRQAWYQLRLRTGGRLAPAKDLDLMLESGGWRTSLAAIWLIAAGRRGDLRPRMERDLLAGRTGGLGWSYCIPWPAWARRPTPRSSPATSTTHSPCRSSGRATRPSAREQPWPLWCTSTSS